MSRSQRLNQLVDSEEQPNGTKHRRHLGDHEGAKHPVHRQVELVETVIYLIEPLPELKAQC